MMAISDQDLFDGLEDEIKILGLEGVRFDFQIKKFGFEQSSGLYLRLQDFKGVVCYPITFEDDYQLEAGICAYQFLSEQPLSAYDSIEEFLALITDSIERSISDLKETYQGLGE
jgi:hypothetical protein